MIGKTLGHYQITEKLGAGGMGEVYLAFDQHLPRQVAIKVLPSGTLGDEQARKRFRNEAFALSRLNHPGIAAVHDFDSQEGIDFLAMEYVPGTTLSDCLASGPLPEPEVITVGVQIAAALEEAHENGVVHRDLKPGNIILTPRKQVKVLDFGLAKLLQPTSPTASAETLTQTQGIAGTLPYMAPEQLLGQAADARSDIWALGVVLYEMAGGVRPFQG
jgi:serine/threonine protein kinase